TTKKPLSLKGAAVHKDVAIFSAASGLLAGAASVCHTLGLFSGVANYLGLSSIASGVSTALITSTASAAVIPVAVVLGVSAISATGCRYCKSRSAPEQTDTSLNNILEISINGFDKKDKDLILHINTLDADFVKQLSSELSKKLRSMSAHNTA